MTTSPPPARLNSIKLFGLIAILVLAACGGGGGGGESTQATTITVIDGYIKGATVCVDKNSNGVCDTGETQGTTTSDGKVTLNIPASDVGKYSIVAEVPVGATDSVTGAVTTAYTMKAPANSPKTVTPYTTMVQQQIDKGSKYDDAVTYVVNNTGITDPTSNFMTNNNASTLARTMVALHTNRVNALNALASCTASKADKEKQISTAIASALSNIKSTSSSISACSSEAAQKTDACKTAINTAVTSIVSSNTGLSTTSLQNSLSAESCHTTQNNQLAPTASVTGVNSGGISISNGGKTDSLAVTLRGSYTAALGTDYSVHVLDGDTDVGAATKNDADKTWSLSLSNVAAGKHDYKAVVVKGSLQGTASSAYTIYAGNSVGAASSGGNVLDSFTLTLSNLWSSVKSVVFTFAGNSGDLADGQQTQTINAPQSNGIWQTITTAFKSAGSKVINLVFKDAANGAGNTLESSRISLTVGQGSVSQTASISSVKDHATPTAAEIEEGAITKDTRPVISGTVTGTALGSYYDVAVFDNDSATAIQGTLNYTDNKTNWSFTPTNALSQGAHAFEAAVVRIDGVAGNKSSARNLTILSPALSFSPASPNVLDIVRFTASNLHSSITDVVWDLGDGTGLQSSDINNSTSRSSATYDSQGSKTITVSYNDTQGITLLTDTLTVSVGLGSVSQNASVTSASQSTNGRIDGFSDYIVLSGTYTAPLGLNYSVHILDGNNDLGAADSNDDTTKTWSKALTDGVAPGQHDYKAVVVRNIDGLQGTVSPAYTIYRGDTVKNSNSSPKLWDEFTLTLKWVWSNVTSVVYTFATNASDMADSVITKTASLVNGVWDSVTTAFKTVGTKTIAAIFKDIDGNTVDSRSISVNVGAASVTQIATITDVKDGSTSIADNGSTTNTQPTISGTVTSALGTYYKVNLYDGNTQLVGTMTYGSPRTTWTFTPNTALDSGTHTLTAKVATFDAGATGTANGTRTFTVRRRFIDTGITASQCYGAGSNTLISCTDSAATSLNSQQDGMVGLDVSNPDSSDGKLGFSYSEVPRADGNGNYARTDCVKDNITGLTWEGKPASGTRGNPALDPNDTYSNYAMGYTNYYDEVTQSDVNADTNAQGYVNAVNAVRLCGYSNWRLPTRSELMSLVDYGVSTSVPAIDSTWFPNTPVGNGVWTLTPSLSEQSELVWLVYFGNAGKVDYDRRTFRNYVRLVRQ